jgi:hypothetical protein
MAYIKTVTVIRSSESVELWMDKFPEMHAELIKDMYATNLLQNYEEIDSSNLIRTVTYTTASLEDFNAFMEIMRTNDKFIHRNEYVVNNGMKILND